MKSIVLAILLILIPTSNIDLYSYGPDNTIYAPVSEKQRQRERFQAMIDACLYTDYLCVDIKTPKVVYEWMRPTLYGYYNGGDTIFINSRISGWDRRETLMHESVHYIQTKIGGAVVPGPAKDICAMEEEAFATVDQWYKDWNQHNRVVGPNWWRPYSHCHQWYNPDWKPFIWDWFLDKVRDHPLYPFGS